MKPAIVIAVVVGVGIVSFYGGVQYQKSKAPSGRNFMMGQQGNSTIRRAGGGQPVTGEILSLDEASFTVKIVDGSSRIVLLTDKTLFNKTASVQKTEIKVGEKVGVFGVTNSDGSISAQSVQLNPQFRVGAVK